MIRIKIGEEIKEMTLEELRIQIEQHTISPDVEIQSKLIFGDGFWRKLGNTKLYQQIMNKQVGISGVAEKSVQETTEYQPITKAYGIPTGAIIAIICFFLPWLRISCDSYVVSKTGADLADWDGTFWLILLAALAILGSYFYYYSQKRIEKCKTPTVISFVVVILVAILKMAAGIETPWGNLKMGDIKGVTPEIGIFGVIIGFLVSFVSALALPSFIETTSEKTPSVSSKAKFCANCGSKISSDDKFCPNCGTKIGNTM
jgi:ribosomal protein S27AE